MPNWPPVDRRKKSRDGSGDAMIEQAGGELVVLAPVLVGAWLLSMALIALLRPWLARRAMARPNARSAHRVPTPQGGGLAVITASFLVVGAAVALAPGLSPNEPGQLLGLAIATALLCAVGAVDDMRPLPQLARLLAQCIAVGVVLAALPDDVRLLPQVPRWIERACLLLGGVWMVNLTNFMDGIDWMTVAEFVPVTATIALVGWLGATDWLSALVAAALLGSVLGFAPFNRPTARLFLGDAGSLPLGLLLGWLLLQLAVAGHVVAAAILPLYYVADATITLGRRLLRGEAVWQAHRSHFYQRAIDNGLTVRQIVGRVFLANIALAALALISIAGHGIVLSLMLPIIAGVAVAWPLVGFARPRK